MEKKFTFVFFLSVVSLLFLFSSTVYSVNHYYYWNKKIDLVPRNDRIMVFFKEGEITEREQRNELDVSVAGLETTVSQVFPNTWLIKSSDKMGFLNTDAVLQLIAGRSNKIKTVSKVYYGDDPKVILCPLDEIIVRLRNESDKNLLDYLNEQNGTYIVGEVSNSRTFLIKTKNDNNLNGLDLAQLYRNTTLFEFVEPNFGFTEWSLLNHIPNDLYFPSQWALKNTGQAITTGGIASSGDATTTTGLPGADMQVSDAWNHTTGSPSIKIAIVDTGIDSAHADLVSNVLMGYDAITNVYSVPDDPYGHGTQCAGLIGATMDNSIGVSGIAPGCKIMSIRIFDAEGSTSNTIIIRALDTAFKNDIDVMSNSWGGGPPSASIESAMDTNAIKGRGGLGTVILASSGNDGINPPNYPSAYKNVFSVGASTFHDNKKSPGSGSQYWWGGNYGSRSSEEYLGVVAPTICYTTAPGGGYDATFNGTSASYPNAAGVAALILSVDPTLTRTEVLEYLSQGCEKIDNVEYDEDKPYGKWNSYYGYGRVNAYNSVRLAAGVDVVPPSISHKNIKSHSSTYPTKITAEITDHDGTAVPTSGDNQPKLFYRKRTIGGSWGSFDSVTADSYSGSEFTFYIPGTGYGTEVNYYIRSRDAAGNESTFPLHATSLDFSNLCYFAIGTFIEFTDKISGWNFNYSHSISPVITVPTSFPVLDVSVKLHVRNARMIDLGLLCLWAPGTDTANYRKCMYAQNYLNASSTPSGGLNGCIVNDTAHKFWFDDFSNTGLWTGGEYKPDNPFFAGLVGTDALGSWKFLGRDRYSSYFTYCDSLQLYLKGLENTLSPSVRHDSENDTIVYFPSVVEVDTIDFYLKNTGTAALTISTYTISGDYPEKFNVINSPDLLVAPGDSTLFKIECNPSGLDRNSASPTDNSENAILTISNDDPSKSSFKVSLQNDGALPVDFVEFNTNVDKNNVTLNWTTAWEENNMRFDIQRRNIVPSGEQNESWKTIGSVAGSGTVNEPRSYSYLDKNLVTGTYEYKLTPIDVNGNSTADILLGHEVEIGIPNEFAMSQNYPNPFNPSTKIDIQIPVEGMTRLVIFDLSGREVATLVNEILTPGYYTYNFTASNLASGVYFYRLSTKQSVITKRMVLVK